MVYVGQRAEGPSHVKWLILPIEKGESVSQSKLGYRKPYLLDETMKGIV